ncbi:MAG: protein translocase subunit SecD [bacterium]|nr:protein translocase subunit SecD [bacterium]
MSGQKWLLLLTVVLIVLGVIASWNTINLWTMTDEERQELQETDPGELLRLQQKAIRLGLDLQGGIHVVLRVKMEELDKGQREEAVDRAMAVIRSRIDGLGVAEPTVQKQGNERIIVDLPGYTDASRAEDLIGQMAVLEFKLLENMANANLLLTKMDTAIYKYEMAQAPASEDAPETAETPEVEEPVVAEEDTVDVLAELMGQDSADDTLDFGFDEEFGVNEDTRPFTSRLLEVTLQNSRDGKSHPGFVVAKKERPKMDRWINLPEVQALIPVDVQFSWSTRPIIRNSMEVYELFLLKRKVQFVGKYLQGITIGQDQYGGPEVRFKIDAEGSNRFAQLTGANINKPLAIVLDGKVESAAFINTKIRGSGSITMGSSATLQDARNLEIVLEAGSLPAPVEFIEKNIVGASLGADSISKGFYASLVGLLLVLLYIGVYYRLSGIIADIGLLFNIFFLLAIMAALGATLTMPGIAGIILTIGISVDANILIFERIREELRTGKTVRASIDAGYQRAFVAIFDSHVTTLITAGALFIFGSGPIKGFAVTLFWGVTISLYTAYVITRSIFDIRKGYQSLSI